MRKLGIPVDGDEGVTLECPHCHKESFQLRQEENVFRCSDCREQTEIDKHLDTLDASRRSPAARTREALASQDNRTDNVVALQMPPREAVDRIAMGTPEPGEGFGKTDADPLSEPGPSHSVGETIIVAVLALAFLLAGLLAAAMSGFANYQAFGAMVDDPLQSRVWAWTGIIASVCSFGGFTFVYWHWSAGRLKEGLRAVMFALAGAATSLVGTQMFMAGNDAGRTAQIEAAGARAELVEAQVTDWSRQLDAIPGDVRAVDGLEAYIAEVERVGRSHQKPYRDAKVELGLARRRAQLETQIETARGELADLRSAQTAPPAAPRAMSWFFAAMLEVFSSQGTSIGFVALMILAGRRRPVSPAPGSRSPSDKGPADRPHRR